MATPNTKTRATNTVRAQPKIKQTGPTATPNTKTRATNTVRAQPKIKQTGPTAKERAETSPGFRMPNDPKPKSAAERKTIDMAAVAARGKAKTGVQPSKAAIAATYNRWTAPKVAKQKAQADLAAKTGAGYDAAFGDARVTSPGFTTGGPITAPPEARALQEPREAKRPSTAVGPEASANKPPRGGPKSAEWLAAHPDWAAKHPGGVGPGTHPTRGKPGAGPHPRHHPPTNTGTRGRRKKKSTGAATPSGAAYGTM